jgi:hypothetical protein
MVLVAGPAADGASQIRARARVANCRVRKQGGYRVGLSFEDLGCANPFAGQHRGLHSSRRAFRDYYEVLQLSPNADPDMVSAVYRMLAERYRPANRETGDQEKFKLLKESYRILSNPRRRAAYDVRHEAARGLRAQIFSGSGGSLDIETEQSKRRDILSLLHARQTQRPERPAVTTRELERQMGCPRQALEFAFWYLEENGWVARTENGRWLITAAGVESNGRSPSEAKQAAG